MKLGDITDFYNNEGFCGMKWDKANKSTEFDVPSISTALEEHLIFVLRANVLCFKLVDLEGSDMEVVTRVLRRSKSKVSHLQLVVNRMISQEIVSLIDATGAETIDIVLRDSNFFQNLPFQSHVLRKAWSVTVRSSSADGRDLLDISDEDLLSLDADSIELFGVTNISVHGARKLIHQWLHGGRKISLVYYRHSEDYQATELLRGIPHKSEALPIVITRTNSDEELKVTWDSSKFRCFTDEADNEADDEYPDLIIWSSWRQRWLMTEEFLGSMWMTDSWLECFAKFCIRNEPCVLSEAFTADWPARQLWVREDGTPNLDFLRKCYGAEAVPVTAEDQCDPQEMTFSDFCDYCKDPSLAGDSSPRYVKDWHFQKRCGVKMYHVPAMLSSDWVNREEWTDDEENPFRGDYRFVYFGVKDSWTKFHSDVMSSHSWSANICGRKLWYFVPPSKENLFMQNKKIVEDIRPYQDLWEEADVITLVQNPGEIVFVPTNWYHQVHNLEDALSINHNSLNASNIFLVYKFLRRHLKLVKAEIGHLSNLFSKQEMVEQEQFVLGADARLNMPRLRRLLQLVISDRSQGSMAVCYVCPRHGSPKECAKDSECLKRFGSQCRCTTEKCGICDSFMKSFELSIAISLLEKLTSDGF
ncbi:JmjC domain protein [Cooperia oncophora]